MLLIFLFIDILSGIAFLLLPSFVAGLLFLLKNIFGVLLLPFVFLFHFIGLSVKTAALNQVSHGLMASEVSSQIAALCAILCIISSGISTWFFEYYVKEKGSIKKSCVAPLMLLISFFISSIDLFYVMLPALIIQLYLLCSEIIYFLAEKDR